MKNYLEITGQIENGKKISSNIEKGGRFHTNWLNMIFPRLHLARNLLTEDGVIFISMDDSEIDNLKKICSEIFGDDNFIANIVWQKNILHKMMPLILVICMIISWYMLKMPN